MSKYINQDCPQWVYWVSLAFYGLGMIVGAVEDATPLFKVCLQMVGYSAILWMILYAVALPKTRRNRKSRLAHEAQESHQLTSGRSLPFQP